MKHEAHICGCTQEIGMSKARKPRFCKHGHRLEYVKPLGSKPTTKRLKPGKGFSASKAQRDKVRGMPCVACGREASETLAIDPMHVWPRSKGGCDSADCVLPGCRVIFDGSGCHQLFDEGKLDLLPRLADSEAWQTEQAHPIIAHGVSPVELVRRLSGGSYEFVKVQTKEAA